MVSSFIAWLDGHTRRFCDLPEVTVPSAEIDDDQVQHQNDLHYMADLVDEFAYRATQTAANVAGPLIETVLARPVLDDQDGPVYPGVDVLDTLAGVRRDLDEWCHNDWLFHEQLRAVRNGGPRWVTA